MSDEREGSTPAAEEPRKPTGQGKKFFLVGLLGAAVGAVTAILVTPWRGSEAREKLKAGAAKAGAAAKEGAIKAGAAAKEGAAKAGAAAKEKATELVARVKRDDEDAEESKKAD